MQSLAPLLRDSFSRRKRNRQFAVAVSGGTSLLGLDTCFKRVVNPSDVSVSVDCANAFNECDRAAMFQAIEALRSDHELDVEATRTLDNMTAFAVALYGQGTQQLSFFLDSGEHRSIECGAGLRSRKQPNRLLELLN